ncbi:MAG: DNA repair protein RecN [Actinobacteria bacterium]|nr:DNA repair protein RecN [Actinomycetota bacterium]
MLDELLVENLGLIAHARVEPGPGLIAVTGETGAGKTLLLGALRLLRGDAARRDRVGPGGPEARVEGRFLIGGQETVVSRRVEEGRSRAYVDGSMVPRRLLEERLRGLVEIVAQHEHLALGREATVRAIVDAALDPAGEAVLAAYVAAWEHRQALRRAAESLGGDRRALEREVDLVRHQAREIAAAAPAPGEDRVLAVQVERLRHAQEIVAALGTARAAVAGEAGVGDTLGGVVAGLRRAAVFDPELAQAAERAHLLAEEAADLGAELRRRAEAVEADPAALDAAQQRLAVLADLRRKYGETLEEVIAFGEAALQRAGTLTGLLERADGLAEEAAAAETALAELGTELTGARRAAGARLAAVAEGHLRQLGFRNPVLRVIVESAAPAARGADRVELLFASDAALEPAPVARVASGGELSRLVLAVHLAAGVGEAPVVAFDEIDAGIGGTTALAMGEKLAALAAGRQVLVVTHLPQVAAFADTHLVVDREGSTATVRRIDGTERLAELTRMLGGLPASERGRGHAAELVEAAAARRAAASG